MRIAIIILSLLVAGCAEKSHEETLIIVYKELVAAQELQIELLERKTKLLEVKCNVGHEI